jgi:hypothetical protein
MGPVLINVVVVAVVVLFVLLSPFVALSRRPLTGEVEIRAWTGAGLSWSALYDCFDCGIYEPLLPRHHVELPRVTIVTEQRPPRASA